MILLHILGIDNVSGYWYAWWSGSGSVLIPPVLTATPIVLVQLRHKNCHQPRCWRLGRFEADGYKLCSIHHDNPLPPGAR